MLACNFNVDKTHTTQHAVNHFKIESTTVQNNKLDSDLVQIGYIHKQSNSHDRLHWVIFGCHGDVMFIFSIG